MSKHDRLVVALLGALVIISIAHVAITLMAMRELRRSVGYIEDTTGDMLDYQKIDHGVRVLGKSK